MIKSSALTFSSLAAATLLALGACSDSNDLYPSSEASLTVEASLGAVSGPTVRLYEADGQTLLASAEVGADGRATLRFRRYLGPVVIEVAGDSDAQYFDEGNGSVVRFPEGAKIRALSPSASGTIAVTALTELAYQGAMANNLLPLDEAKIQRVNEAIRAALAPEISSILTPATRFDAATTAGSLPDTEAGRYALRLAALARLGATQAAPALAVLEALIADLQDGLIDGARSGAPFSAPYVDFAATWQAAILAIADAYGSGELRAATGQFARASTRVNFSTGTASGGSGTGTTTSAVVKGVKTSSCSAEGSLKSSSGAATNLTFENATGGEISLYWLDYQGQRVLYKKLPAGQTYLQGTFVTHPWLLTDAQGACIGIYTPEVGGTTSLKLVPQTGGTASNSNATSTGTTQSGSATGNFEVTCNTNMFTPGAVELPTAVQLAAYAGTYNGDEGTYAAGTGAFVKSGSTSLTLANDGRVIYNGTAYTPTSICLDKVAGPYGRVLYVMAGNGHFDIAPTANPTLGQAWGVSPVDGLTIFTKGVK